MSKAHDIVRTGLTFAEFFRRFPDDTAAEAWFESRRWLDGPQCPHCDSDRITAVKSRRPMPYRCKTCRKHFSVTSHTVMHQSKLGCQTWLLALFLIVSNPKGRSSVQLAADLGVTQKTAWHLAHLIREALTDGGLAGFGGPVEADETYIGGKARNMHAHRRKHMKGGRSTDHKTAVVGVKDRGTGRVSARPVIDVSAASLTEVVSEAVAAPAVVFTDEWRGYRPLTAMGYDHARVAHGAREYVRGEVHTNGIENYWSHLKRTYVGTYHYWSAEHLHRYVDEHSFRYNRRSVHVLERMDQAAAAMGGRRLTYRDLTGSRG